jgi:hypothetical protein
MRFAAIASIFLKITWAAREPTAICRKLEKMVAKAECFQTPLPGRVPVWYYNLSHNMLLINDLFVATFGLRVGLDTTRDGEALEASGEFSEANLKGERFYASQEVV